MKRINVTEGVFIEALGPSEAEHPLIYIVFDDYPERQAIPIFVCEVKTLIAALTSAAVWIADQVGGET